VWRWWVESACVSCCWCVCPPHAHSQQPGVATHAYSSSGVAAPLSVLRLSGVHPPMRVAGPMLPQRTDEPGAVVVTEGQNFACCRPGNALRVRVLTAAGEPCANVTVVASVAWANGRLPSAERWPGAKELLHPFSAPVRTPRCSGDCHASVLQDACRHPLSCLL
jgi:hypothetical protein